MSIPASSRGHLSLLNRIKLQNFVWRCSDSPKGSTSFFACSQKKPPALAGGVSLPGILEELKV